MKIDRFGTRNHQQLKNYKIDGFSVHISGAVSIIGYKHMLQGNGDAAALLPVFVIFTIPLILGFIFVTSRSAVNGELAINKVMRGDIK
jgi:hypothetical protein